MSLRTLALGLLAVTPFVAAQTSTECNPNNSTCPANPALGTTYFETYNESQAEFSPIFYNVSTGKDLIKFDKEGAHLTLSRQGESIRVMSAFNIFFGRVECVFKAAKGKGIISTVNLISDNLDEIDWEVIGSTMDSVATNYYGWGNITQLNGEDPELPGGAFDEFHNYTIDWTEERLVFILDDEVVRTVPYGEPGTWPQTPSHINLGIWSGGDPSLPAATQEWAGGKTDWDEGPFTMTIKSLKVIDGHQNVSFYSYGDQSGSFESIEMQEGDSYYKKEINKKSAREKAGDQWQGLSTGAKIGIAAGVGSVALIGFAVFLWFCMRQRKQGKAEREKADETWNQEHAELEDYKQMMTKGGFAVAGGDQHRGSARYT